MAISTLASATRETQEDRLESKVRRVIGLAPRYPRLIISGLVVALVLTVSVLAPALAPHDPLAINPTQVLQGPQSGFPLGTDEFGRDILSRLLYGARPSLAVAAGATALALILGMFMGLIAGYSRGSVEQVLMRLVDVLLCFPPILLAMAVVGMLGPGVRNLILIIGVLYAPIFARLAFASTIQVTRMEFMEAARAVGSTHPRMIMRHVLPNILSPLIIQASLTAAAAILLESGLSFLGLGVAPPTPSWGLMIGAARGYMYQSATYVLWPSLLIAVTVLAINTFGDALRDALDPRLRQ